MAARGSTPKRRPVWVDKKQFPSLTSAAAFLSEKTDCKFYPAQVSRAIGGKTWRYTLSETKPELPALCEAEKIMLGLAGETEPAKENRERGKPLLRYDRGEHPWERWLPGVWR